jgi:hypothetical protein
MKKKYTGNSNGHGNTKHQGNFLKLQPHQRTVKRVSGKPLEIRKNAMNHNFMCGYCPENIKYSENHMT